MVIYQVLAKRFGKGVREMRRRRNISQEKLASLAGVHRTYVGMVERGEKNVTLNSAEKFAKALGVKVRDLVDF
ncbi:MAG: helix-turn-helix transcriptional regulator [Patescibacteria group bacterium]